MILFRGMERKASRYKVQCAIFRTNRARLISNILYRKSAIVIEGMELSFKEPPIHITGEKGVAVQLKIAARAQMEHSPFRPLRAGIQAHLRRINPLYFWRGPTKFKKNLIIIQLHQYSTIYSHHFEYKIHNGIRLSPPPFFHANLLVLYRGRGLNSKYLSIIPQKTNQTS